MQDLTHNIDIQYEICRLLYVCIIYGHYSVPIDYVLNWCVELYANPRSCLKLHSTLHSMDFFMSYLARVSWTCLHGTTKNVDLQAARRSSETLSSCKRLFILEILKVYVPLTFQLWSFICILAPKWNAFLGSFTGMWLGLDEVCVLRKYSPCQRIQSQADQSCVDTKCSVNCEDHTSASVNSSNM